VQVQHLRCQAMAIADTLIHERTWISFQADGNVRSSVCHLSSEFVFCYIDFCLRSLPIVCSCGGTGIGERDSKK